MALPAYLQLPEYLPEIGSRVRVIDHVRRNIQDFFGISAAQAEKFKYQLPCSQPQSVAAQAFQQLWAREQTLVCTPKADGVRYGLYFLKIQDAYFTIAVDRKYQCWALDIELPLALRRWYEGAGTFLDAELVLDQISRRPYFLVFDVIVLAGQNMRATPTPFVTRYQLLAKEPLSHIRWPAPFQPLALKAYELLHWGEPLVPPRCTYATDGLICFPPHLGIVVGRNAALVRLKKAETLDVAYVASSPTTTFALCHAGIIEPILAERDKLHVTNPHHLPLQLNAIYECTVVLEPQTGMLEAVIVLLRTDKQEANDISTLHQLQACLRDPMFT